MMELEELGKGIQTYGTPMYVFDLDALKAHVQVFRDKLKDQASLCFAMKANSFLTGYMQNLTDRIEVCSMGEFMICRDQKIRPEKVLISGVLKKEEDLREIMNCFRGRCRYSVESVDQFYHMADWCEKNQESIRVYLRLTSGNQFGMDEETLEDLLMHQDRFPLVKIQGIHYFSGTQKKNVEKITKELEKLDSFCLELEKKTGLSLPELEYGPGLAIPYFEGQEETLEADLTAIGQCIGQMNWKGKVTLEMGRALSAPCGYYLTSIRDIKQNHGRNYCIVDGGIHQVNYDGQIRGMYQPKLMVWPERAGETEKEWTICGSLCTVNDVLVKNAKLGEVKPKDVLIFAKTGAYAVTEGMALFLSHELPKVAFYSRKQGWKLVREEQLTYTWNMERM